MQKLQFYTYADMLFATNCQSICGDTSYDDFAGAYGATVFAQAQHITHYGETICVISGETCMANIEVVKRYLFPLSSLHPACYGNLHFRPTSTHSAHHILQVTT